MKACVLRSPAPIETNPLEYMDVPKPAPSGTQVLVRVNACAVCRTDLHVIEGELPPRKSPITPGHQVVGMIEAVGDASQTACHRNARRHRLAAFDRRHVRILPRRKRKSLRQSHVHRLDRGRRLCRVRAGGRDLRLSDSGRLRRSQGRAAAVRGHHRLPGAAAVRHRAWRTAGTVRIRSRGPRGHSSGASLGRRSLCLHAR